MLLLLSASFAQEVPGPAMPKITVDFPPQNFSAASNYAVFMFTYNGEDENDWQLCSVLLNNLTLGEKSVRSGDDTTITIARIPEGEYNWSIKCANYTTQTYKLHLLAPKNESENNSTAGEQIKNINSSQENASEKNITSSKDENAPAEIAPEPNNSKTGINMPLEGTISWQSGLFATTTENGISSNWLLLAAAAILIVGAIYFMLKR